MRPVLRAELIAAVPPSPTLAANERVQAKLAAGEPVLHLAFGEAGLPVLPAVAERLAEGAGRNGYGPVAGSPAAREAAAGYFERRGLPTDPAQIVFAPGSKPLLFALLQALPGDVVLPVPCWVSYAAHAALAGKRVIGVPIGAQAGGVPDPAHLRAALAEAAGVGARPGILVLTLPDNPTGTVASEALVREVCEVAEAADLLIVCDEIYRDLALRAGALRQPRGAPARARVRHHRPEQEHGAGRLAGRARAAARRPAGRGGRRRARRAGERDLVGARGADAARRRVRPLRAAGGRRARGREPPPAPRGQPRRLRRRERRRPGLPPAQRRVLPLPRLRGRPFGSGAELADDLLGRAIAVLAGEAFGDDPAALRVRMATSLLYGDSDEQKREALASDDPAALPWIAASLDRLRDGLA